jgi:hypothetical protein
MAKNAFLVCLFLSIALPVRAAENPYQWILNMQSKEKDIRREAAASLLQLNDASYAPAMVDMIFFMPRAARGEMVEILEKTTGHKGGEDYYDWVEYIGKRSDLKSPAGYVKFKVALLSLIDPAYKKRGGACLSASILLYRSNKLMYDRQTFTLWGNLSGQPVVGKMATSDARLRLLRMTSKVKRS